MFFGISYENFSKTAYWILSIFAFLYLVQFIIYILSYKTHIDDAIKKEFSDEINANRELFEQNPGLFLFQAKLSKSHKLLDHNNLTELIGYVDAAYQIESSKKNSYKNIVIAAIYLYIMGLFINYSSFQINTYNFSPIIAILFAAILLLFLKDLKSRDEDLATLKQWLIIYLSGKTTESTTEK